MTEVKTAHWALDQAWAADPARFSNFVYGKGLFKNHLGEAKDFLTALRNLVGSKQLVSEQVAMLRGFYLWVCPNSAAAYDAAQNNRLAGAAEPILEVFGSVSKPLSFSCDTHGPASILDIGCGSGAILSALAAHWDVSTENALGLDLVEPATMAPGCTFIPMVPDLLPAQVRERRFDLTVASLVLHHSEDPDTLLEQVIDCMSAGAYLILREHNADNPDIHHFLNTMHVLYEQVFPEVACPLPNAGNYRSMNKWISLAESLGLQLVSTEYKEYPAEVGNTSQNFLAVFKKVLV